MDAVRAKAPNKTTNRITRFRAFLLNNVCLLAVVGKDKLGLMAGAGEPRQTGRVGLGSRGRLMVFRSATHLLVARQRATVEQEQAPKIGNERDCPVMLDSC